MITKEFLKISLSSWQLHDLVGFNEADVNPKRFDYQKLRTATKNFSKDRKLGAGAYGAVYKVFSSLKCISYLEVKSLIVISIFRWQMLRIWFLFFTGHIIWQQCCRCETTIHEGPKSMWWVYQRSHSNHQPSTPQLSESKRLLLEWERDALDLWVCWQSRFG